MEGEMSYGKDISVRLSNNRTGKWEAGMPANSWIVRVSNAMGFLRTIFQCFINALQYCPFLS